MKYQFLVGILLADGSFTGNKTSPAIVIRMRDTSKELLEYIAKNFNGTLYGPYYAGKTSHANGSIYQVMWNGAKLKSLLPLIEATGFLTFDANFALKYSNWKIKFKL